MVDTAALARFHLASGARVALRASVPIAGAFVVAVGMSQYPGATLAHFAAAAAAANPDARFVGGTAALAIGLASWAAPRVATGSAGWMRSLPAGASAQLRALGLGVAAAIAPLPLTLLAALVAAGWIGQGWNGARVCALIPMTLGAAHAVLPVRRRILSSPLAMGGVVVALSGGWLDAMFGAVLVGAAVAVAGPPARPRGRKFRGSRWELGLAWIVALRALRSGVLGAWAAAAVPLLAGALFLTNNALPASLAARGARLAIGIAIVVTLAALSDRLAQRRPPWPWARSLPWSSQRRASDDALVLGALASPIVVVSSVAIDARSGLLAVLLLPVAAMRAAAALRHAGEGRTGVAGPIVIEGGFGALAFALSPWFAVAALAATPHALRAASRREAAWKVSRWTAVQRLPAGDPADWTGR